MNHAAWVLCGLCKYDYITPALQALHWLPIWKRIEYEIAVLYYKCIHMLATKYLCDTISIYTPKRRLRSSLDKYLLNILNVLLVEYSELVLVSKLSVTVVHRFGMIYLMMGVHQNLWILLNKSLILTYLNMHIKNIDLRTFLSIRIV